jgi:hypothetical protein
MGPVKVSLPHDCAAWLSTGHTIESIRCDLGTATMAEVRHHMLARLTFLECFLDHPGVRKRFVMWGKRTGLAKVAEALRGQVAKEVQGAHKTVSLETRRLAESFKSHYEATDPAPLVNDAIAFILSFRSPRRGPGADEPILVWPWLALDLVASFQEGVLAMTGRAAEIQTHPPLAPGVSFKPDPNESYPAMMYRLSRFYDEQMYGYHKLRGKISAKTASDITKHAQWFYRIEICGEPLTGIAQEQGCNIHMVRKRLDAIRHLFDLSPYSLR